MIHAHSAGGIVLNIHGQIALAQQGNNSWSFPKGHVNPGEDFLTAAKREIYEETGLQKISLIKPFSSYDRSGMTYSEDGERVAGKKTIHLFLFTTQEITLKPLDPQNPTAVWMNTDEVSTRLTHPKDKEFFLKILPEIQKINSIA